MARELKYDNKWHRAWATRPVLIQTDFSREETVVNESILFKYCEARTPGFGFSEPYVYALDTEHGRRFHGIKDRDISDEPCRLPTGIFQTGSDPADSMRKVFIVSVVAVVCLVALIFLLSGCVSNEWSKVGGTPVALASDKAQCEYEAQRATASSNNGPVADGVREVFLERSCLQARGWRQ